MLKNIRLHIEKDEQKQAELDKELAQHIFTTHNASINAFQRNIPSLLQYVQKPTLTHCGVFINKFGEHNIVDYGVGRTLYGFHPAQEIREQLKQFQHHTPEVVFTDTESKQAGNDAFISCIDDIESVKLRNLQAPLPESIECLVVLGCGLGIHIKHLLQQYRIKNLIIYEPELQYFQCSVMTLSWQEIFSAAKKHQTAIFLQLEKDGRDIIQDIEQLIEHRGISSFHLMQHYNHPCFNIIQKTCSQHSWKEIKESGIAINTEESYLDYLPNWTPTIRLEEHSLLKKSNQTFARNLQALKKYFPDIYAQFHRYEPLRWLPIINGKDEVNILKQDSLNVWYGNSPKHDCALNFENFNEQPNKDGLVLGYKGNKLAHYIHYQFVKETEALLEQAEEETGALPEKVPSLIMFGIGVGYQLETLFDKHSVEKLFICEPNPDFFYASLYAIDWQRIFETIDETDARIYLNIGDDGTNLFRDLLNQFYAIGPYILNSTYFYQSYYNASLNTAISQLREQLQVVISMGEYFDHAYYGITHTKEGLKRKIPVLTSNPGDKLTQEDRDVPVFLVGNGPSLDSSIAVIKEWQQQAIIISCGTALQALHRQGITPDFHTEIEQNRTTYDWAVLIGDLDYLKRITLISCNGIHPDTCDLYKDVMIAFKEGESSTVSALNLLGREHFEVLQNAFPTVGNFACDLFSKIGFNSIYLIGIDLGFIDVKHHHSKLSEYYREDGEECYDYEETNNTSIVVPGNFRPVVNTKYEFKVARQVIEQVIAAKPSWQAFFNSSDGALIQGATPIKPEAFLITTTSQQKARVTEKLISNVFCNEKLNDYQAKFKNTFSQKALLKELKAFQEVLTPEITSKEDVQTIVEKQKELLFDSYRRGNSLLFYYLYGTVNFANAAFTKLLHTQNVKDICSSLQGQWRDTMQEISAKLAVSEFADYDISSFKSVKRERMLLEHSFKNATMLIISDSAQFRKANHFLSNLLFPWVKNVTYITQQQSESKNIDADYCIYYDSEITSATNIKGRISTISVLGSIDSVYLHSNRITQIIEPPIETKHVLTDPVFLSNAALYACFNNHKSQIVIPKYKTTDEKFFKEKELTLPLKNFYAQIFEHYICIGTSPETLNCSNGGLRGELILEKLTYKHLLAEVITQDEFALKKSRRESYLQIDDPMDRK